MISPKTFILVIQIIPIIVGLIKEIAELVDKANLFEEESEKKE